MTLMTLTSCNIYLVFVYASFICIRLMTADGLFLVKTGSQPCVILSLS